MDLDELLGSFEDARQGKNAPDPEPVAPPPPNWDRRLEADLDDRRRVAEDRYRDLTSDLTLHLRRKCKNNLFFLCTGPLEYDRLSPIFHGHHCRWLAETREERYRIILEPRGHYKSTVDTIGESVQIALPDDDGNSVYPWNLGPDVKILIGHEVDQSASRFLFEIAQAFMSKPLMLALYPECIPSKRNGQRINQQELELPRSTYHKEPTFDTIGTGGRAQGRHYNRLKLDDIIGEAARESPTLMLRAKDWLDNINSLLTRLKIDGWDLIGTRWSLDDVYGHAMGAYGINHAKSIVIRPNEFPEGAAVAYIRGAIENGKPIFPEEFTLEDLARLRRNMKVWAAQYANDPLSSGLTEFQTSWLKYYNYGPDQTIVVFSPSGSRKISRWDLDRFIFVDPSMGETEESDETGIVVAGTDKKLNIYVLETIKKRMLPPEVVRTIFNLYNKWYPRVVSIEEVGFSAMFRHWIDIESRKMEISLPIVPYKASAGGRGAKSKDARIRGLTSYFEAGQVYILEGMHEFREEYERFPLGKTNPGEHLLDAFAQGPSVFQPALSEATYNSYAEAERKFLAQRDSVSGY